jgi:uncharacterized coiled-coil protein SlyX
MNIVRMSVVALLLPLLPSASAPAMAQSLNNIWTNNPMIPVTAFVKPRVNDVDRIIGCASISSPPGLGTPPPCGAGEFLYGIGDAPRQTIGNLPTGTDRPDSSLQLNVSGTVKSESCPSGYCFVDGPIPLSSFANSSSVNAALAAQNGQITTANGQIATLNGQVATQAGQISNLNGQVATQASQIAATSGQVSTLASQVSVQSVEIAQINSQIIDFRRQMRDSSSFIAAVGAMNDAVPDAGDRYAIRLNTATVNGVVAGGVSLGATLGSGFRASVNYAGARGQNAVSAGLNFSFR